MPPKPIKKRASRAQAPKRVSDEHAIVAEVGERMKRIRMAAGLTLEQLCVRSGVSRAMLSKVERGEKSPTLTVIVMIAKGLDVSLTALMGAEPKAALASRIRASERLVFRDPETGFERHVLSPPNIDSRVEFLMHRIPPGQSSGMLPAYNGPTEKFIIVQTGRLSVTIGASRHDLAAGDSFHFEVREPYRFDNPGKTACVYYLAVARG